MKARIKPSKKLIYLDHAATTPVRPEVLRVMQPYWSTHFGNPSSLYKEGVVAKEAVEIARRRIADVLMVRPQEVIFTAGGTESINLAILGVARNYRKKHKTGGHIITSTIEHHAVLHACQHLEQEGFKVTYVGVDGQGFFKLDELKKAIRKDTLLVSLMYANNEIGTIEPIIPISKIIAQANASRSTSRILFHVDACQAAGFLDIRPSKLGVDLLSLNGSKIYGPKQTGCLYSKQGVVLEPLMYGGGQEKDIRSGTENVPGIVGFAQALKLAQAEKDRETKRLRLLRDWFLLQLHKIVPECVVNGSRGNERLVNNINITIPAVEGEALMLYLDAYNVAVSTGSACTTESTDPSHVLKAIGLSNVQAKSSIRVTLGKTTTKSELAYTLKALSEVLPIVRNM